MSAFSEQFNFVVEKHFIKSVTRFEKKSSIVLSNYVLLVFSDELEKNKYMIQFIHASTLFQFLRYLVSCNFITTWTRVSPLLFFVMRKCSYYQETYI